MKLYSFAVLLLLLAIITNAQTVTLPVFQNDPLQITFLDTQIHIPNGATLIVGSDVIISGGQTPYQRIWSSPSWSDDSIQFSILISPDETTEYTLTVIDNNQCSISQTVTIFVDPTNNPPIANAGNDQLACAGIQVVLDGTLSYDPDGQNITYSWISPIGIELDDSTSEQPKFLVPDVNIDTNYQFYLVVNDGVLSSNLDTVIVLAKPLNSQISNQIFSDGSSTCFNAYQTITVAGYGTTVILQSGSTVDFIAGESIHFLPGFHSFAGSNTRAYITTDAQFCDNLLLLSEVSKSYFEKSITELIVHESHLGELTQMKLKIYPNPNNGFFKIKIENCENDVYVSIVNIHGVVVYMGIIKNELTSISLPLNTKGICFVQAINGQDRLTQKIIIQ